MGHIFTANVKIITGFVGFLFLLVSWKGCGLWLWHSLDFSLIFLLNDYCTRWCTREPVESNALIILKLKIFKIIDEPVLFYSNNLDLIPPKPKLSFRYLKQNIQEIHRKYALVPADKAADYIVVVWRLHYINTLIQELGSTKTYKRISTDERSIVDTRSIDITAKFAVGFKENQGKLSYIGFRNFINDLIKLVSL